MLPPDYVAALIQHVNKTIFSQIDSRNFCRRNSFKLYKFSHPKIVMKNITTPRRNPLIAFSTEHCSLNFRKPSRYSTQAAIVANTRDIDPMIIGSIRFSVAAYITSPKQISAGIVMT